MPSKKKAAKKKPARRAAAKRSAPRKVQAVPKGYNTVSAHLVLDSASEAIEFYKKAFGAKEVNRMPGPGGKVMHAELQLGDSRILLADDMGGSGKNPRALGGTSAVLCVYMKNAEALWNKATAAGAQVLMPLADQFWGDKYGQLKDPYGHVWAIMEHLRDVSPAEMAEAAAKAAQQMPPPSA